MKTENNQKSVQLRKKILEIIYESQASHIASCFSMVEILSAIYRSVDLNKIKSKEYERERVIVSKGHSAAALYVVLDYYGLLKEGEIKNYYKNGSLLSGHVTHHVSAVEHSTGALGHGLSVGLGIATGFKSKKINSRVYVVCGDGELQEGSNWEALMLAGHLKLNNLCLFVDCNKLAGVGKLDNVCCLEPLKSKLEIFGWSAFEVDGHNEEKIYEKIQETKKTEKPTVIICNTIKGKGVSFMENNNVWHYRPPNKEEYEKALLEIEKGN